MTDEKISELAEEFVNCFTDKNPEREAILAYLNQFGKQIAHETMMQAHYIAMNAASMIGRMRYEK